MPAAPIRATQPPDPRGMQITVHDGIAAIDRDDWNALVRDTYPFLRYEFLHAAEQSGSVCPETGWAPCHVTLCDSDGSLRGALPLYEKTHSWGEFVFDWAWANAYQRAGLRYYPKLVSAVPFTPASSTRLLLADRNDSAAAGSLIRAAITLARERDCSSVHFLFPADEQVEFFRKQKLEIRKDCQFHWHNRGYPDFEAFLLTFSSAKRKKARRDRRRVQEAGITFRRLTGADMRPRDWHMVYELISRTFMRRGSMPYYNLPFFETIGEALGDQVLVVLAESADETVAAAIFLVGADILYGRYWGSAGDYNALHFETCYYQGIDFCIEHGISTFEPGTQGEHKISRGFVPRATWSAHWLAHPQFFSAIGEYVREEARHIDRYMQDVGDHSPYRRDRDES